MGKAGKNEDVREEPLTAILLADSFSTRMRPITSERPKTLLPLVNSPMIEYALEWLASSEVAKVHILCCSCADQIKDYLDHSTKWTESKMEINCIMSYNCQSAGEAFRLLDQQDIIKDDFILVSGDTVTNMNLATALEAHKKRRAADKSAIMTIVATQGMDVPQRVLMGTSDLVITLDRDTHRLLSFHTFCDRSRHGANVDVDTTFFSERDALDLRYDLQVANIYICAPEVLMLFSENFDFQHIQRDFIKGVLSEEELGNKLYLHILNNEYAAHVASMRSYCAVSQDILSRWLRPLCPDSNLLPAANEADVESDYFFSQNCIYKESSVRVVGVIGELVCLGLGTAVAEGAVVSRSVLGRRCFIGCNATVTNSFLLGHVTVGEGATVSDAFICDRVKIGAGAVIGAGCVISFGCVIAPGHVVPPHTRITLLVSENDQSEDSSVELEAPGRTQTLGDGSDDDEVISYGPSEAVLQAAERARSGVAGDFPFDTDTVGISGAGFNYYKQQGTQPAQLDILTSIALPSAALAEERVFVHASSFDPPQGEEGAEGEDASGTIVGDVSADPEQVFKREVQETLLRTMQLAQGSAKAKEDLMENAVIELNALKIAEVRTFADCACYVLTTLMRLHAPPGPDIPPSFHSLFAKTAPDTQAQAGKLELLAKFKATLSTWAPTLRKFLREEDDQFEVLLTLEEFCGARGVFAGPGEGTSGRLYVPIFSLVLAQLHEEDVICEDVFLKWEEAKTEDDEDDQEFLRCAKQFFEYLKRDDDSEEEEGDDEESEESDEDMEDE